MPRGVCVLIGLELILGFLLCTPLRTARAEAESPAESKVRQALEAEAAGDLNRRETLLAEAKVVAEKDRRDWNVGLIRHGKQWESYETIVDQSKHAKALEQYLKKRANAEPTLESQVALAHTCDQLGLVEQERAHWSSVLMLAPDHAEARKKLGFKLIDGIWLSPEELKANQDRAKRVALATRNLKDELEGIAKLVGQDRMTIDEAVEKLAEHAEATSIPAWELYVSTPHERGSLAVIAMLARMTDPAAAPSLARHALYCGGVQAREAAIEALKKKEEQSYVPSLLAALRGPWLSSLQMQTVAPGVLVYRYSMFSDSHDRQQLQTLDQAFFLQGDLGIAARTAAGAEAFQNANLESSRRRQNYLIALHNEHIMSLLTVLTGQDNLRSPQDWWKWWDDHNEVYSTGEKPLEQSYAYQSANITGIPTVPHSSTSSSQSTSRRCDCLAGGTPILTSRGPVAIDRLRIGDLVVARDPVSGETALKPVLLTNSRAPEPLIRITLGENKLRASGGHPFWVSGTGWVRARELKPAMILHGFNSPAAVSDVEIEEKPARSFNIVVADYHSYFVGSERVFSHDNTVRQPVSTTVPGLQSAIAK